MGGLEAVDLRDGAGDDDAHGVGHVIRFQRLGDGLLQNLRPQADDIGIIVFFCFFLLFSCHNSKHYLRFFDFLPVVRLCLHLGQLSTASTPNRMRLPQLGQRQYFMAI